ncbi:MAG: FRG domain-containing protein [Balneola sp.]
MSEIKIFRLNQYEQLFGLANPLNEFIFRGEGSYEYGFKSTLERIGYNSFHDGKYLLEIEENIIDEFRSIAGLHEINAFNFSTIELLSLLRHYGGPVRFLDFTYSIYIAAYFACLTPNEYGVIWCLNRDSLDEKFTEEREFLKNDEDRISNSKLKHEKIGFIEGVFKSKKVGNELIYFNPLRSNKRIFSQQGTFLFPESIRNNFKDTLCEFLEIEEEKKRFYLKRVLKGEAKIMIFMKWKSLS